MAAAGERLGLTPRHVRRLLRRCKLNGGLGDLPGFLSSRRQVTGPNREYNRRVAYYAPGGWPREAEK